MARSDHGEGPIVWHRLSLIAADVRSVRFSGALSGDGVRVMTSDDPSRPLTWTAAGLSLATRPDFANASSSTLRLLRQQLGHDLWMVTRVEGDDLIVLDCLDHAYGLRPGDVLPWSATLDWRMVHEQGPRVAPRVADVPAYVTAGLTSAMTIGSYAGVPMLHEGRLFGTLTGLHPV